jgi:hypothetical protein
MQRLAPAPSAQPYEQGDATNPKKANIQQCLLALFRTFNYNMQIRHRHHGIETQVQVNEIQVLIGHHI